MLNYLESIDPNIQSEDEGFTALHFSARYVPRIIDMEWQQQELEEGGSSEDQAGDLTSKQAMLYLLDVETNIIQVDIRMKLNSGNSPIIK